MFVDLRMEVNLFTSSLCESWSRHKTYQDEQPREIYADCKFYMDIYVRKNLVNLVYLRKN